MQDPRNPPWMHILVLTHLPYSSSSVEVSLGQASDESQLFTVFPSSTVVLIAGGPPGDGMLADSNIPFLGALLKSGDGKGKLSSVTFLPGAIFIVVGLLSRPDSYYKVS